MKRLTGAVALLALGVGCTVQSEETRTVSQGQEAACSPVDPPLVVWREELPDCGMCADGFDACLEGDVVHVQATPPRVDSFGNSHARMVVTEGPEVQSAVVHGSGSCARVQHHSDWAAEASIGLKDSDDYCLVAGDGADYTITLTGASGTPAGDFRVELGTLEDGQCSLSCDDV